MQDCRPDCRGERPPRLPRAALAAAAAVLALCGGGAAAQTLDVSPAARMALGIETEAAEPAAAFAGAEASATVIAPPGRLRPAVSPFDGVVLEPLVMPGLRVEEGDPVAVIYSQTYVDARAELETRRLMAEHTAELAGRADRLFEAGLISETEAEEAHHDATEARLTYEASRDRLADVQAEGQTPGRYVLTAPASGVVAHVQAESGQEIAAQAPAATVFAGDSFWARALAPERAADLLRVGAPVEIAGWSAPGELIAIDPEVDPASRSLEVLVALPEGGPWRLGRILDLSFQAEAPADAVAVPVGAVVGMGEADIVFVERAGGFDPVAVDVLARSRERVLVGGDVAPGAQVAVSGLAALKNMAEGG